MPPESTDGVEEGGVTGGAGGVVVVEPGDATEKVRTAAGTAPTLQVSVHAPTVEASMVPVITFWPVPSVLPYELALACPLWVALTDTGEFGAPVITSRKLSPTVKGVPGRVTFDRVAVAGVNVGAGGGDCGGGGTADAGGGAVAPTLVLGTHAPLAFSTALGWFEAALDPGVAAIRAGTFRAPLASTGQLAGIGVPKIAALATKSWQFMIWLWVY